MQFNEMLISRAGVAGYRAAPLPTLICSTTICAFASREKMMFCKAPSTKFKRRFRVVSDKL